MTFHFHDRSAFNWHNRDAFSWDIAEVYAAVIGAMCFAASQPVMAFSAAYPAISMALHALAGAAMSAKVVGVGLSNIQAVMAFTAHSIAAGTPLDVKAFAAILGKQATMAFSNPSVSSMAFSQMCAECEMSILQPTMTFDARCFDGCHSS